MRTSTTARQEAASQAFLERQLTRREFVRALLATGLTVTATGGVLAACQRRRDGGAAGADLGRIRVLVGLGQGTAPAQVSVQQALAQAFERRHPGTRVSFDWVSTGSDDALRGLRTLIAQGDPPDLLAPVGLHGLFNLVDGRRWLDLAQLARRDGLDLARFRPEARRVVNGTSVFGPRSGAVLGLPVALHTHALAYNARLFRAAGVPLPPTSWTDPSWTYGRMRALATALTVDLAGRHPGQRGFDLESVAQYGLGHFFPQTFWFGFGAHRYDPVRRVFAYDSPQSVAGLQYAADLVHRAHVQPTAVGLSAITGGATAASADRIAWRTGKLAMIDFFSADLLDWGQDLDFEWGLAAMPAGPARRFTYINVDLGVIVRSSRNPVGAWQLLRYLTTEAADKYTGQALSGIAPRTGAEDVFRRQARLRTPAVDPQAFLDALTIASTENEDWTPHYAAVSAMEPQSIQQIMDGSQSAAQAMRSLQRRVATLG